MVEDPVRIRGNFQMIRVQEGSESETSSMPINEASNKGLREGGGKGFLQGWREGFAKGKAAGITEGYKQCMDEYTDGLEDANELNMKQYSADDRIELNMWASGTDYPNYPSVPEDTI